MGEKACTAVGAGGRAWEALGAMLEVREEGVALLAVRDLCYYKQVQDHIEFPLLTNLFKTSQPLVGQPGAAKEIFEESLENT